MHCGTWDRYIVGFVRLVYPIILLENSSAMQGGRIIKSWIAFGWSKKSSQAFDLSNVTRLDWWGGLVDITIPLLSWRLARYVCIEQVLESYLVMIERNIITWIFMYVMSYRQDIDNYINDHKNTLHKDPLCGLIPGRQVPIGLPFVPHIHSLYHEISVWS